MAVVDETTRMAEDFEARLRGKKAPSRCPLCLSTCVVEATDHAYGEGYVTELHYLDCPVCGIVYDCRQCYRWQVHEMDKHPCPEKLEERALCKCPWEQEKKVEHVDNWPGG